MLITGWDHGRNNGKPRGKGEWPKQCVKCVQLINVRNYVYVKILMCNGGMMKDEIS